MSRFHFKRVFQVNARTFLRSRQHHLVPDPAAGDSPGSRRYRRLTVCHLSRHPERLEGRMERPDGLVPLHRVFLGPHGWSFSSLDHRHCSVGAQEQAFPIGFSQVLDSSRDSSRGVSLFPFGYEKCMDAQTTDTFEEARRQLFDPDVENEDIRLAEESIQRAEAMLAQATPQDLRMLEERIKSQKQWIRTLKQIQSRKIQRQNGIRQIAASREVASPRRRIAR